MTQNEHIYAIKNIINKGPASDDSRITNGLILYYLNIARSLLIKRKLDRDSNISDHTYLRICVPLEKTTYHDCTCIDEMFDCKLLRSKCKLPTDILSRWGRGIMVKTINGKQLDKITMTQNEFSTYSRSGADKQVGWFIEDNYLYIQNTLDLPLVIVKGIWTSPEDLDNYCGCGDSEETGPCYDVSNDDYPVDPELVLPMHDLAYERIMRAFNYPEDNENNARDTQVTNERE